MIIYCENVFRLRNKTGPPVKRVKLLVESVRVKGKILVFIYFFLIFSLGAPSSQLTKSN